MKHEWLMNSKLWTLAWMVLFAVLLLASGVLTLGQEPHHDGASAVGGKVEKPADSGAKPKAAELPAVPLTADEAKDVEIDQLKKQKLELEIDRLTRQIADARQAQSKETQSLTERLLAAHSLDAAKYRLDPGSKAFVPIGEKK